MPHIRIQFSDRTLTRYRYSRHLPDSKVAALITNSMDGSTIALLISKHPTLLNRQIRGYIAAIEAGEYQVQTTENIYTWEESAWRQCSMMRWAGLAILKIPARIFDE